MKKILFITLVVIFVCAFTINTALSYFVDTDYDYVNTMTVGNVTIEQHEMYRTSENQLLSWLTDGAASVSTLLPVVGDTTPVATEIPGLGTYHLVSAANVLDKIVYVKNTGNEDAFLRTLFAFEMIPVRDADGEVSAWIDPIENGEVIPVVNAAAGTLEPIGVEFTENGVRYVVYVFVYSGALSSVPNANSQVSTESQDTAMGAVPPNISVPSLLQVYLASSVGNEFYQAVGSDYSILIISQAVQSTEFTNAADAFAAAFPYGENGANVSGWFVAQSEGGESK